MKRKYELKDQVTEQKRLEFEAKKKELRDQLAAKALEKQQIIDRVKS